MLHYLYADVDPSTAAHVDATQLSLDDPAQLRKLILNSGLFHHDWYSKQNPDVRDAGIEPLDHYIQNGSGEGRFPNPIFDPSYYRDQNRDVVAAGKEPLGHYIQFGAAEGRKPSRLFDANEYRLKHPDAPAEGFGPMLHYLYADVHLSTAGRVDASCENVDDPTYTRKLIVNSGLFHHDWYSKQNPDVHDAGIDPLHHYIHNGSAEGRFPNPLFDPNYYRDQNPDVVAAGEEPLAHYIARGSAEGRRPNRNFDPAQYRAEHPDLQSGGMEALAHFLLTSKVPHCGSILGARHQRLTNYPTLKLPDFFQLRSLKPAGSIAVVVHLYYPDIWKEMRAAIGRIPYDFDLFVTLVAGTSDHMENVIRADFPHVYVFTFSEDRGRDIARFIALLQTGVLFQYELICKLHSKRSTYVSDGDEWRRSLIDGILGDSDRIRHIVENFRSDSDLGMVVADGNIFSGSERWTGNEAFLNILLPRIGITTDVDGKRFPGGGIYWIRPLILRTLLGAGLDVSDFEPEPMPVNGALGHAVERMVGLICEDAGMRFVEYGELERCLLPKVAKREPVEVFAFYLPQFHPVEENNAWWGEGFTEWTNVTRAMPLFSGHRQPRLPSDLGFCDLRLPETRQAQAQLAKEYSVSGFCYYYYWFNGRKLLDRPIREVVESGQPDFPFMICWANEPWSRNWDGLNEHVLLPQTYELGWEQRFASDVRPILNDPRYFRQDGKPMLLIYRVQHISSPDIALRNLRSAFVDQGVGEVHIVAALSHFLEDPDLPAEPSEMGLDAYYEFPPHHIPAHLLQPRPFDIPDNCKAVFDYGSTIAQAIENLGEPVIGRRYRSVMAGFDNTARRGQNATIFHGATPTNFRRWFRRIIQQERGRQLDQRLVFINAWNEWAEGTYLEPDADFGRGWLEAVASAAGP
jgi:lipopolysaccharide biosynthesis protein